LNSNNKIRNQKINEIENKKIEKDLPDLTWPWSNPAAAHQRGLAQNQSQPNSLYRFDKKQKKK
jgi:hypothetical protein